MGHDTCISQMEQSLNDLSAFCTPGPRLIPPSIYACPNHCLYTHMLSLLCQSIYRTHFCVRGYLYFAKNFDVVVHQGIKLIVTRKPFLQNYAVLKYALKGKKKLTDIRLEVLTLTATDSC